MDKEKSAHRCTVIQVYTYMSWEFGSRAKIALRKENEEKNDPCSFILF